MKKFKFNIKLTASLVSLFVAIVLIVIGTKNKYCLGVGLMLLGLGSFLYAWDKRDSNESLQNEANEELSKCNPDKEEDKAIITELHRIKKDIEKKTKRTTIVFTLFGIMMVVMGFISFF